MTELPQSAVCPFGELLDKRILGDLTPEDRARLEAHLGGGCPSCSERWKTEEKIEGLIEGAMAPLTREVDARKPFVLDKLKEQLAREDDFRRDRRRRRIGMNAVLFLIVILGVTLLSAEYFAYAAMRKKLLRAQHAAAQAEVQAILHAVRKLAEDGASVPAERPELIAALSQRRADTGRAYYAVDSTRIDSASGLLLDPWGHAYVYQRVGAQVRLYSIGPNGKDEDGAGDDVGVTLVLPK